MFVHSIQSWRRLVDVPQTPLSAGGPSCRADGGARLSSVEGYLIMGVLGRTGIQFGCYSFRGQAGGKDSSQIIGPFPPLMPPLCGKRQQPLESGLAAMQSFATAPAPMLY